jgi:hypothetical protein
MKKFLLSFAIISSLVTLAQADELVLTSSKGKSASATAVDYVSDGKAAGAQITFTISSGAKADLSALKISAGDFQLVSAVNGSEVVILLSSPTNASLPNGVVSLGNVTVRGGSVTLKEALAADVKLQAVPVKLRAQ